LATLGEFGYIKEKTAVYRFNPRSASSPKVLDSFLKYCESVNQVKRFLRDVLFEGELNDIYPELILTKDFHYQQIKIAFTRWRYLDAKKLCSSKELLFKKSQRLSSFTKNRLIFYFACFLRLFIRLFHSNYN
jgi:hypothetical protein